MLGPGESPTVDQGQGKHVASVEQERTQCDDLKLRFGSRRGQPTLDEEAGSRPEPVCCWEHIPEDGMFTGPYGLPNNGEVIWPDEALRTVWPSHLGQCNQQPSAKLMGAGQARQHTCCHPTGPPCTQR